MSQAEYLSTGSAQTFSHYGLALEYYTHFTSPIRRYADILVYNIIIIYFCVCYLKILKMAYLHVFKYLIDCYNF